MGKPINRAPKKIYICCTRHDSFHSTGDTLDEAFTNFSEGVDAEVERHDLAFYEAVEIDVEIKTIVTPVTYVTAK